jgi:opacity protein-like surface antigen
MYCTLSINVKIAIIVSMLILYTDITVGADSTPYNDNQSDAYRLWEEIGSQKNSENMKEKSILAGFYMGVGLSLASDDFDVDGSYPVDSPEVPFGFDPLFIGNTAHATVDISLQAVSNILDILKVNFNLGYTVSDHFGVEFNFDYLPGFTWNNMTKKENSDYSLGTFAYITFTTLTTSLKYYPYFLPYPYQDFIKPFIHMGIGWLFADIEVRRANEEPIILTIPIPAFPLDVPLPLSIVEMRGYDSTDDMCYKFGIGTDIPINKSIKLTADYSYIKGTGNVKDLSASKITGGIGYIF